MIETMAFVAVDCFALITGFVYYSDQEKEFSYGKYLNIWTEVAFYSFGLTLLVRLLNITRVGNGELLFSMFPLLTGFGWYFSAYTGVYFIIPLLLTYLRRANIRSLTRDVIILTLLFSVLQTIAKPFCDPFELREGYSFAWLALLFILGAWIKKCKIHQHIRKRCLLAVIVIFGLITWVDVCFIMTPYISTLAYTSPTVLLPALAWVMLFLKVKIPHRLGRTISYVAPHAFAVYLIHTQRIVFKICFKGNFTFLQTEPVWKMCLLIFFYAGVVFVICVGIDILRVMIFKLLRVDRLTAYIANQIDRRIAKIMRGE